MVDIPTYKILVIGDGYVGKSSFVRRFVPQELERKYIPNIALDVIPIIFQTTLGPIRFNVWDTAGQEKFGGLRDAYYIGSNACILMFDVTSRTTYKNIPSWHRDVTRICEDIPFVLVGNKLDKVAERKVPPKALNFHKKKLMHYCEISALANFYIDLPFLLLLRLLTRNETLDFSEKIPHKPPEITMDKDFLGPDTQKVSGGIETIGEKEDEIEEEKAAERYDNEK